MCFKIMPIMQAHDTVSCERYYMSQDTCQVMTSQICTQFSQSSLEESAPFEHVYSEPQVHVESAVWLAFLLQEWACSAV